MKQETVIRAMAAASLVALMASPVAARGGGGIGAGASVGGMGGQSNAHISTQGSLNTNGPNAADRDFGRDRAEDRANANADVDTDTKTKLAGRSKSHMSASGHANTNGLNATDRDKGQDRAQDRPAQ
jgi:hypothetical protein